MLYLNQQAWLYEDMLVLPDYSDPRQFYYFPNRPHLAVDEQNRPAIRFIAFKADLDTVAPDEEHAVGFLTFDTSLAWPEATIRRVARKIQDDLELDEEPRLAPLLFKSGTVRLMFLDRQTEPPPPPGEEEDAPAGDPDAPPPPQRWVTALEASGIPSLYGENRAIFSATLTKEATQLLYAAFDGFVPAGVVYELTFVGMQRAFNVHAEVDWEQVYHHFAERFALDAVFFSVDIQKIVDELEAAQVIKLTGSLEGVGDEGMEGEFNAVRKQIQEFILEKFFKPVINPTMGKGTAEDQGVIQDLRSLRNVIAAWPDAGYSRIELDLREIHTLDIDYTVARAVERTIAPQAHLSLFFEDYAITRDQVVTIVSGDDPFWKEVEFDLALNADFAREGIAQVAVDVDYSPPDRLGVPERSGRFWSFTLDPTTPRVKRRAWYDPEVGHNFRYRYTVFFTPGAVPGPRRTLSSGWRAHEGSLLVITPAELYQLRQVEAQVVRSFPFERYPQVFVHLQHKDPTAGWMHEDSALLDAQNMRLPLAFRTDRAGTPDIDYRFTFLRANGTRIEGAWATTAGDLILVQDPIPNKLVVRLLVAGDRSKIANLLVNFRYEDEPNDIIERGFIAIDPSNIGQLHQWSIQLADPGKRRYAYSQTLLDSDGNLIETGWIQDERETLPVGMVFARMLEVQPQLVGPPLSANRLELIKLNLSYRDPRGNRAPVEHQIAFAQPGKGETWKVPIQDAAARDYTYELTYVLSNGFERNVGPFSSRDTFLVVSSVPPRG